MTSKGPIVVDNEELWLALAMEHSLQSCVHNFTYSDFYSNPRTRVPTLFCVGCRWTVQLELYTPPFYASSFVLLAGAQQRVLQYVNGAQPLFESPGIIRSSWWSRLRDSLHKLLWVFDLVSYHTPLDPLPHRIASNEELLGRRFENDRRTVKEYYQLLEAVKVPALPPLPPPVVTVYDHAKRGSLT